MSQRETDERVLLMIRMRCAGKSSAEIADALSVTRESVRVQTNRVRHDDIAQATSRQQAKLISEAYW